MTTDLKLNLVIKAIDHATAQLARVRKRIDETLKPARRLNRSFAALYRESGLKQVTDRTAHLGRALGRTGQEARRLATRLTLLGGGLGYLFKRLFLDTAAEFERYDVMLRSLEGSHARAKKAMSWISDFATKVPYQFADMMQAFIQLRTWGLDPYHGTMQAVVDATAKMGGTQENLRGIVLALGQAWGKQKLQGQEILQLINQGIPVWSILTQKTGSQVAQLQKLSEAGRLGKGAIKLLIQGMEEWSHGAAAEQAQTWAGMISMIADWWTRFANMVMDAGLFGWMKGKLHVLMDTLTAWARSGRLQQLAHDVGHRLVDGFRRLWAVLHQDVWPMLRDLGATLRWLHDLFGSWKPIIIGAAAIMAGPLLVSIVSTVSALGKLAFAIGTMPMLVGGVQALGKGMGALGRTAQLLGGALLKGLVSGLTAAGTAVHAFGTALLTTPLGWIVAAVAAIAAAVYLIYKNWDSIAQWFRGSFLQGIVKLIAEFNPFAVLLETLNGLIEAVTGFDLAAMLKEKIRGITDILPDWLKTRLRFGVEVGPPTGARAQPLAAGTGGTQVGGSIQVHVTSEGRAQVQQVESSGPVGLDVTTGYAWGAP